MRLSLKKSNMCTLQSNNQCVRICTVGWISWSAVGGGDWRVVVVVQVVVVLWSLWWRCSTDSSSVVRCWRSLGGCAELFWTSPADTSMSAPLLQRSIHSLLHDISCSTAHQLNTYTLAYRYERTDHI